MCFLRGKMQTMSVRGFPLIGAAILLSSTFTEYMTVLSKKMTKEEIGKRMANERKAQGLSIRQLAKMCEISTTTLQGVEKGWFDGKLTTYLKVAEMLHLRLKIEK